MSASGSDRGRWTRRLVLKRDGPILILLLLLTLAMTNPLALHIASAVEDKQDALLNTWIIAWVGHALITDPAHLFNAPIFYPYPNTLAFSETLIPQGLLALPLNLAFDNPVLGYNVVLFFSFWIAAYGMYLFVLDLTRNRLAGLAAGVVFAFNPFNLGNLAQIQLLSFGWTPLALLFLRRLLYSRDTHIPGQDIRWSQGRNVLLFALFFSLQALSSVYFAFLAGIAVGLYILSSLIARLFARPAERDGAVPLTLLTGRLAVAAILIAILTVPVFLPYLSVQREMGFQRKLEESEPFSASLKLYTEVSPSNVLYGRWLAPNPPIMIGNYPLDNLFPGLIALGLAACGALRGRRERGYYLVLLVAGFVLSLGPRFLMTPSVGTAIQLPYRWLYENIPVTHALRAPVRFDALVMLALAVLSGIGVQRVVCGEQSPKNDRARRAWPLVSTLLLALIPLEYLSLPAANITVIPTGQQIPGYVAWLAEQPQSVILELPMLASDPGVPPDLTPQYLSTFHWQRTPDGYNGFNPPKRGEFLYEMQSFPGERSISLLQGYGVSYVIVHSAEYAANDQRLVAIAQSPELHLTQRFGPDFIYQVAPRSANPTLLKPALYVPDSAAPGQRLEVTLILSNQAGRSIAILPTEELRVVARWMIKDQNTLASASGDWAPIQTVAVPLPLVTTEVSTLFVPLIAPPTAGQFRLDLHVSGAGSSATDLHGEVAVEQGDPVHIVVLPAQVRLSRPLLEKYAPGENVEVYLDWFAANKINAYYSVSVRIVNAKGDKVASEDRQPVKETMYWKPGEHIPDRFALPLPKDLAPGHYQVELLMYQADLGIAALLLDSKFTPQETISLGTIVVE